MSKILAVNAGSSSLKFQLYEMPEETVICGGIVERIGQDEGEFTIKYHGEKKQQLLQISNHQEAVALLIDALIQLKIVESMDEITGVGHRIVHGGELYPGSVVVTEDVIRDIESLAPLAPLHNPAHLVGIHSFIEALPQATQVVVFDTAFHQTMHLDNFLYPIPYEYYEKHRIRRYGFHGTSHQYVSNRVASLMNRDVKEMNIISVHLGNGASITAIEKGLSVNTSMGFTPLAGIMMGTRCGDVDPSIMPFLMKEENMDSDEVLDVFNHRSGMLGISGFSSDARDIIKAYDEGNERAILTRNMYANRVSQTIGSYFIQLETVDAIVFTGGIGENASAIRKDILDKISVAMQLKITPELNSEAVGKEIKISEASSKSEVWVVPTNEELVIARDTYHLS